MWERGSSHEEVGGATWGCRGEEQCEGNEGQTHYNIDSIPIKRVDEVLGNDL